MSPPQPVGRHAQPPHGQTSEGVPYRPVLPAREVETKPASSRRAVTPAQPDKVSFVPGLRPTWALFNGISNQCRPPRLEARQHRSDSTRRQTKSRASVMTTPERVLPSCPKSYNQSSPSSDIASHYKTRCQRAVKATAMPSLKGMTTARDRGKKEKRISTSVRVSLVIHCICESVLANFTGIHIHLSISMSIHIFEYDLIYCIPVHFIYRHFYSLVSVLVSHFFYVSTPSVSASVCIGMPTGLFICAYLAVEVEWSRLSCLHV
ncbi:unnamed protein product [Protopolystoma xenopodis]|uniref:Uncharacterized protein n=1 Tax=Protopolystoma xenopodis TaxID=117903 RepID=A0A3S5FCN1_9PLAT|nr:unnamed protein product [Protopolystoma xenopodis]